MKYKIFFSAIIIFTFLFSVSVSLAATSTDTVTSLLEDAGKSAKYDVGKTDAPTLVGNVFKIFITLLGVIFLGLLIYGGYTWMTARGDSGQADKSKEIMTNAVIGLVITVTAYAISYFVLYMLAKDVMQGTGF